MAQIPVTPKAYHNWPNYDDDLVNKIYVDQKIEEASNDDIPDDLSNRLENVENQSQNNSSDIVNLNNDKMDTSDFDTFLNQQYNPLVDSVDSKIETWSQGTNPADNWNTLIERETHLGDIWFDTNTNKTYTYQKDDSQSPVYYYWRWQDVPIELLNNINSKSTIYSGIIPSEYKIGDFWIIPLSPYTNTSSIISQTGDFTPGMILNIEGFILEVLTTDSNDKIITYNLNIPSTSNFSLDGRIISEDDVLEILLTSTSPFELPIDCYGGSIAVAKANNTNYDSDDWIKRSNPLPEDKSETVFSTKVELNQQILEVRTETSAEFTNLGDSLNFNVNQINTTIIENQINTDGSILELKDYTQAEINELQNQDEYLDNYISYISTSLSAQLQLLSDSIISTIRTTGGNNLLKNSVGFKNRTYWEQLVNSILQRYTTAYGQKITISFKFKKIGMDLAIITLNRTESSFDTIFNTSAEVAEWTNFDYSYIASVNQPYIKFNSLFIGTQDNDAENNGLSGSKLVFDNGLMITDLIINYGDKQPWTPYFDEVYGKSHRLDASGLDLLDLASDKMSHLDSNSLDFLDSNGNIESVFSKVETISDNYYANNSIKIGNLNIIKLDDNNILEY